MRTFWHSQRMLSTVFSGGIVFAFSATMGASPSQLRGLSNVTYPRSLNRGGIARDVILIGASAGGLNPLLSILRRLPSDLPATIAVVMHRSPTFRSELCALVGRQTALPVLEPTDGDPIAAGRIYLAPRDMHMVMEAERWRLLRGPRMHWTRPAVDPLFSSGAHQYGHRVVGVLLSGCGGDGVEGLIAVKAAGGLSLVQDPHEAQHPDMPRRAIADDHVDAALMAYDIAAAIPALVAGQVLNGNRSKLIRESIDRT